MKTIKVCASHDYDIIVDRDLLSSTGKYIRKISKCTRAAIISDTNVWPIYGKIVEESLKNSNIDPLHFIFTAGEQSKNSQTYINALNFLAENKLTRSDLVIALGGGVVGDLAGFTAATFLRGIPYVQLPTSLLAMVDSSVGGKTAIDLPSGKNLAGAFYQPSLVLCDLNALNTLPDSVFIDGCAEVIKYGILYDEKLFAHLEEMSLDFNRELVISRCVELKRNVVMDDEFDTGARQKLNLGHTFGHAVEKSSNYAIPHGHAVAVGTVLIAKSACKQKLCSPELCEKITRIFQKFHLPVETNISRQSLLEVVTSDKKRSGQTLNLIIPSQLGNCEIYPVAVNQIGAFVEAEY